MAIVPTKDINRIKQRAITPNFQTSRGATPAAFGALEGRTQARTGAAISKVGQQITDIAIKQKEEDDEREVKQGLVDLSRAKRELTYGESGLFAQSGQAALDAEKPTREAIEKARNDIINGMKSSRAKQMFGLASSVRLEKAHSEIDNFTLAQRKRAANDLSNARITEGVNNVAAAYGDEETIDAELTIITKETAAKFSGQNPEIVKQQITDARTVALKAAIDSALQGEDTVTAEALFKKYEPLIAGNARAGIKKSIEDGSVRRQVQTGASLIMNQGLDTKESLALARKEKDPKVQDGLVKEVKNRLAERDLQLARAKKGVSSEIYNHLYDKGSIDEYATANPEKFKVVSGDGALMSSFENTQARVSKDEVFARTSDGKSLADFLKMPAKEKAEADLNALRENWTEGEYNKAVSAQQGAVARIENLSQNRGVNGAMSSILKQFQPVDIPRKKGKKPIAVLTPEEFNIIEGEADTWIKVYQEENGKNPTEIEMKQKAQQLMLDVRSASNTTGMLDPFGAGIIYNLLAGDSTIETVGGLAKRMSPDQKSNLFVPVGVLEKTISPASGKTLFQEYRQAIENRGLTFSRDLIEKVAGAHIAGDKERLERLLKKRDK